MILFCSVCEKVFTNPLDFNKHSNWHNDNNSTITATLNQSIGSVEKVKDRVRKFQVKRRSIFDGVDVSFLNKKRKAIEPDTYVTEEDKFYRVKTEKFLLVYNCKECASKFTKLGQFREHSLSHETEKNSKQQNNSIKVDPNNIVENLVVEKSHSEPLPQSKRIKVRSLSDNKYPCDDCSLRYQVSEEYRKPFSMKLQKKLLQQMDPRYFNYPGYIRLFSKFTGVRSRSVIRLNDDEFLVGELKGEGGYAKVFSATWKNNSDFDTDLVLKVQNPANDWEWYILNELQNRLDELDHPALGKGTVWKDSFMSSPRCYTFDDWSVIVSEHHKFGTLLDMINITSAADKYIAEPLAVFLTAEILGLVEILHSMDFIHADLKPDNIMIRSIPSVNNVHAIQFIDFGKTIDLRCIPPETVFDDIVETSGLKSVEMREKRPWRHHIDYFGIAAVVYCLLFGQYIEISKVRGRWTPKGTFKRWWHVDFWKEFFDEFLNLRGADKKCLPSLMVWRGKFLELFAQRNMSLGLEKARELLNRRSVGRRRQTM